MLLLVVQLMLFANVAATGAFAVSAATVASAAVAAAGAVAAAVAACILCCFRSCYYSAALLSLQLLILQLSLLVQLLLCWMFRLQLLLFTCPSMWALKTLSCQPRALLFGFVLLVPGKNF